MDRLTTVLLLALGVLERGLRYLDDAKMRVEMRDFLKDHPDVTIYYPDGERQ